MDEIVISAIAMVEFRKRKEAGRAGEEAAVEAILGVSSSDGSGGA